MTILVLGIILFIVGHLVPAKPDLKAHLVDRFGTAGYRIAFSLVSLVMIVYGYGEARAAGALVLWDAPRWTRHLTMVLMLPVFPMIFAAYSGAKIRATLKHPMLSGIKLWAFAHLIANGTLPDLVLFGGILAWAVVDRISLKRRPGTTPPPAAGWTRGDTIAVAAGLVVYVLFVAKLHLLLIGVSPMGNG